MYKTDSRVRYSEIGQDKKLTIEGIINYFQDCSSLQSEDLGIGLDYLESHQIAWIVNYWQVDVNRYPKIGERIRIGTSPYEFKMFMGLRNFLLETEDGETLAQANSVWSLMDLKKMRPVRAPEIMLERYELFPKFDMEYEPRKIRIAGEKIFAGEPVRVQRYHLDTNHHMNNEQYVKIAMAVRQQTGSIRRLRVEYKKQALLGDIIYPTVYRKEEDKDLIVLGSEKENAPYAVVEIQSDESRQGLQGQAKYSDDEKRV